MSASQERLAEFVLRWSSPLKGLRRLPIVGRCVRWAGAKLVPRDSLAWVQVQEGPGEGLWLRLNPRTGAAYFEGEVEREVQKTLQEYLRPGMTFYDLGANIGFFSLLAARLVGRAGRVVAFEADPAVSARLRENVDRNSMPEITVVEKAMWSEPRTVYFARADPATSPDRGLGHVVSESDGNAIEIGAESLDHYTLDARAPDFMKCDVEGAEVEVFRGAQRVLKERRPGIICEMHSEENRRVLEQEFLRFGYTFKASGASHVLALPS